MTFEVLLEESDWLITEVELGCHGEILLGVQPVTFNVKVNRFVEEVHEAGFDLAAYRDKVMICGEDCLSVDYHSIERHGIRLVLVVIVTDEASELVLVEVEVLLFKGVTRVDVECVQLSLFSTSLLHHVHVESSTVFLTTFTINVIDG